VTSNGRTDVNWRLIQRGVGLSASALVSALSDDSPRWEAEAQRVTSQRGMAGRLQAQRFAPCALVVCPRTVAPKWTTTSQVVNHAATKAATRLSKKSTQTSSSDRATDLWELRIQRGGLS